MHSIGHRTSCDQAEVEASLPLAHQGKDAIDAETETKTGSRETETEDEGLKTESPQTESPQTESPQTGSPQTESPQTESPRTESPETERPETERPETESPELTETETDDGTMPRCRDDVQPCRPPSCTAELSLGAAPWHPTPHQPEDCLPLKLR